MSKIVAYTGEYDGRYYAAVKVSENISDLYWGDSLEEAIHTALT
jgi:hypothetical protein